MWAAIRRCDMSTRRAVASFTLATTERGYRTASGLEVPPRTEWHNIVMWDRAAEFAEKYIRKGTRLFVEGKLRTRTWEDRAALKHTVTEIYVENYDILARTPVGERRSRRELVTGAGVS